MFKFLKGKFGKTEIRKETQRQTAERALEELNEILAGLADKPRVSLDMAAGTIEVTLPDQMPDEALALPAPEEVETVAEVEAEVAPETEGEQKAAA